MEQNAQDYFKRALAKFRSRQDVKSGLDDLEEAICLDPLRWEFFWTRGAFNFRRRARTSAEADLTKAIDLCPEVKLVGKVYKRRMYCYGCLKRYDKLVQDATWLIEHGFGDGNLYGWRGWGHYGMGEIDKAIDGYSRALDLLPNDFNFRVDRAAIYYRSRRYPDTLGDLNYRLTDMNLDPRIAAFIYQFRALTHYQLEDFEKSLVDYNHFQQMAALELFTTVESYIDYIYKHINVEGYLSGRPSRPSYPYEILK